MSHSRVARCQQGLTLVQWGLLFAAFMIGLGSTFVIREVFPPAHAAVIKTAPANPVSLR